MPEYRQCAGAGAVPLFRAAAQNEFHQVEILAHSLGACDSEDGKVYSRRQPSACFINRPFLRLAGAGYLIPLPVEPRGKAMSIDRILIARVLFTLMTAGYAALTVIADFNKTHATNPEWTPHARFHVVRQILSYVGFGLLALALIWLPGPLAAERLYLVALMGAIVYAAFFAALIAMPIYGGAAYDRNGYQPFKAPLPVFAKSWDANITAFSVQLVILAAGLLAVSGASAG